MGWEEPIDALERLETGREDTMLLVTPDPARDSHAGLAESLHGKMGVGNRAWTGGQNQGKGREGSALHDGI